MTDTPVPLTVRSRVRRALAIVALALAAIPLAAGTVVLGWAVVADAAQLTEIAAFIGSDEDNVFEKFLVGIWGVGLLMLLGVLFWAVPIWLGGLRMFGTVVADVTGKRTASAATLLACACCDAAGATLFLVWHHYAPATPYVLGTGLANVAGAVVCLAVVGIAHLRGTQAG